MADKSNIEWTDSTFNPWEGCQKVGPGCDHCYAEARNARYAGGQAINWGPGAPRRRTSVKNWNLPLRWQEQAGEFMVQHGRRRRVFCASLADVFDNAVDPQWRADLFALIQRTPALDWLLLTKRIGNVKTMLPEAVVGGQLPANVWLGATIVNQVEADRDIPKLMDVPARVRFLSMEPLLGPVDLTQVMRSSRDSDWTYCDNALTGFIANKCGGTTQPEKAVNWVIVGGESGTEARAMHPDWARSLRNQCAAAGVPLLFKQWGEWLPISELDNDGTNALYRSRVKAKPHESQGTLDDIHGRVCTVPQLVLRHDGQHVGIESPMAFLQGTGAMQAFRVGKKAAGRLLDGVDHREFPI